MKRVLALAGSLILAFTMSACGASSGPVGTWGDGHNTDKQPYLELSLAAEQTGDQAGYVTGSDGCNRISGQWMYAAGELTFPQLGSTQIGCKDVNTWLSKAKGAKLDGNVLTITDATGAPIGTLKRQG
ncbi:MAG: META domain-containing protein [Specibacter sp.]